jgi:hypothetical protein
MSLNMRLFNHLIILTCALVLFGCASPVDNQRNSEAKVKSTVEAAPSWYANPPLTKDELFVAGTETSANMQMAMDKATLAAKRELALQISSYVSALTKQLSKEVTTNGSSTLTQTLEAVSQSATANINVGSYNKEASKIVQEGSSFRAYVLLSFSKEKAANELYKQIRNNPATAQLLNK